MKYLSVSEARGLTGLRLVLSAYVPGPWGEAAKAIFKARGVAYQPVAQLAFDTNDELHDWTGQRNAPIAMLDDEPPVGGWLDLLMLAERLGEGPSLLPPRSADRALMLGLSAEICAPYGFGWERRLLMLGQRFGARDPPPETPEPMLAVCTRYGYSAASCANAAARVADILRMLEGRLERQRAGWSESPYLMGEQLTACDLYWAAFSNMVAPLPHQYSPMPEAVRTLYSALEPEIEAALSPALLRHRDMIYSRHIGLPLDY